MADGGGELTVVSDWLREVVVEVELEVDSVTMVCADTEKAVKAMIQLIIVFCMMHFAPRTMQFLFKEPMHKSYAARFRCFKFYR